jgi:hypothetical protein
MLNEDGENDFLGDYSEIGPSELQLTYLIKIHYQQLILKMMFEVVKFNFHAYNFFAQIKSDLLTDRKYLTSNPHFCHIFQANKSISRLHPP